MLHVTGNVDFLSAPWRLKHVLLNGDDGESGDALALHRVPRAFDLQKDWTFHHSSHYPMSVFYA